MTGIFSLEKHVACNDAKLHAKIRRDIAALAPAKAGSICTIRLDILQAVVLMKVLFPVKHDMFQLKIVLWKLWEVIHPPYLLF